MCYLYPKSDLIFNSSKNRKYPKCKINKLKTKLCLKDFGLKYIQRFEWNNENDRLLTVEAKKKLVKEWVRENFMKMLNFFSLIFSELQIIFKKSLTRGL